MAQETRIGWTDHTFNPWVGCTKVSAACDNCYAEGWAKRAGRDVWGHGKPRQRTTAANWREPLKWNAKAEQDGVRRRVFCASLADVFDTEVSDIWRFDLLDLIAATPHLDWLLLTKRPKVMAEWFACNRMPPNIWAGTTVENQKMADLRIPDLLKVPAKVRFLSCEPLMGPVDLSRICIAERAPGSVRAGIHVDALAGRYVESGQPYVGNWDVSKPYPAGATALSVSWVICGGESGPGARPLDPVHARSIRDQCAAAGVPFFFKQWGGRTPDAGGKLLDGREHQEFPTP